MAMDRLNITKSFTLDQVKQFAEEAGDKKIRLKFNKDGEKVLYTSNKKDLGIRNFFTGHSEKREARARQGIESALALVHLGSPKSALTGTKLFATLNGCGDVITVPTRKNEQLDVPTTVKVGGETFHHAEHLATKGFGHVHRYVSADNKEIAVKILTKRPETATSEFMMHQKAASDGDAVIGIRGVLVNPTNGQIVVAMDLARGDCDSIAKTLKTKVEQGIITPQVAEAVHMTMLYDMGKAVEQVSNAGMIHHDVKVDNFLLSMDGRAVICDFGVSEVGDKMKSSGPVKMLHVKKVAGESQASQGRAEMGGPEINGKLEMLAQKYLDAKTSVTAEFRADFLKQNGREVTEGTLVPRDLQAKWNQFKKGVDTDPRVVAAQQKKEDSKVALTSKTDSWQLGMTGHQLSEGVPMPETMDGFVRENLAKFGADESKRVFNQPQNGLQRVVNGLMHPDPEQRTDMFELQNDPTFFQTPGFGSPEVRELMKSLAAGDDVAIQRHADSVQNLDPNADANRRAELFSQRKAEVTYNALEATGLI